MFRSRLIFGLILVWCLPGCEPQKASPAKKTAPAKIEHPDEGDIYRVVLTPKAEERLQISTVAVEKKSVPRTRTVGGEVVIPGNIILRQRGTKWHPGTNVGIGKDHTIFATAEGKVAFKRKAGGRVFVSVDPAA